MKAEYKEGPEASENFRKAAETLFQAPKKSGRVKKKRQPKKATSRKSSGKNNG